MTTPRISVIMPVYNAGPYLAEAIQSILEQTFRDFEFIIINDGSTDESPRILRQFASRDSRLIVVDRPNEGVSSALNQAFKLAMGDLVARMDADDISLPSRFARQVDYMDRHLHCVAVGSDALKIDVEGDPVSVSRLPVDHETIDRKHIEGCGVQLFHPSIMIRREAMAKMKGYRISFEPAEDLDLFLRLAEMGELANIPEILLNYRLHDQNTSFTRAQLQLQKCELAVKEACQRRGLPWLPAKAALSQNAEGLRLERQKNHIREAIEAGFWRTARKHAWRIWRLQPLSASANRLLFRSLTRMKAGTALRLAKWLSIRPGGQNAT